MLAHGYLKWAVNLTYSLNQNREFFYKLVLLGSELCYSYKSNLKY